MVDFNPIDVPGLEPGPIRQAANGFRSTAVQIVTLGKKIPAATDQAATDFSGSVSLKIKQQGQRSAAATENTAFMNMYGAGITDHWAQNVADFKRKRQALIEQFENAQAGNFGVRMADYGKHDGYEGFAIDREAAGRELVNKLNAQAQDNYQQLMTHADERGAELRRPPDAGTVTGLLKGGYLIPGLTYPELKTMMNQLKHTTPAGTFITVPAAVLDFGGIRVFNRPEGEGQGEDEGQGQDEGEGENPPAGDEDGDGRLDPPFTVVVKPDGTLEFVPKPGEEDPKGENPPPTNEVGPDGKPIFREAPKPKDIYNDGRRNPEDGKQTPPAPTTKGAAVIYAVLRLLKVFKDLGF